MKRAYGKIAIATAAVGVLAIGCILNLNKDTYKVLDSKSVEVTSRLEDIRDYRKLKGFKVLKSDKKSQVVLISAGLTYGPKDKLEIKSVEIGDNDVKVVVKEVLEDDIKNETINYPSAVIEIDSSAKGLIIKNTDGEVYEEIQLEIYKEGVEGDNKKVEVKKVESKKEDVKVESKKEDVKVSESKEDVKESESKEDSKKEDVEKATMEVEFQGKIDSTSIEAKYKDTYMVFDISKIESNFPNYKSGTKIIVSYEQVGNVFKAVGVRKA